MFSKSKYATYHGPSINFLFGKLFVHPKLLIFYKSTNYYYKTENSHPVHNLFSFYFDITKNMLSFAIAFVNDRYYFYTLTY